MQLDFTIKYYFDIWLGYPQGVNVAKLGVSLADPFFKAESIHLNFTTRQILKNFSIYLEFRANIVQVQGGIWLSKMR